MSDVITRNTPTHYKPQRIAFQPDGAGGIVARADFAILNTDGDVIDFDTPAAELTQGEYDAFLAWFNAKCSTYEAATGLERYVAPQE